jgi:hypothetical protein
VIGDFDALQEFKAFQGSDPSAAAWVLVRLVMIRNYGLTRGKGREFTPPPDLYRHNRSEPSVLSIAKGPSMGEAQVNVALTAPLTPQFDNRREERGSSKADFVWRVRS